MAAFVLFGCSVPEFDAESARATANTCQADADCGKDGQCVSGACRASAGTFTGVLFEITPPSDAPPVPDSNADIAIAGTRFFTFIGDLPPQGGRQDLALDHVAHVMGTVVPYQCAANAKLTFTPSERLLGLSTPTRYTVEARAETGFDLWMAPGKYDVYVQPADDAAAACILPQLVRQQEIPAGDVRLDLPQSMPAELELTIAWPADELSLVGWTLDIVDPVTGRIISEQKPIERLTAFGADGRLQYVVPIRYTPVTGSGSSAPGKELVRLSPPAHVVAPKLLMERGALELFSQGVGIVDQVLQLPPTVRFAGRVTTDNPDEGVAATTVTLIADAIDGLTAGTLAAFEREVVTNADGSFAVEVLAGTYRVHAEPPGGSGRAAKLTTLDVAAFPAEQSGQLIQLDPSTVLSGRVLDPSGNGPLSGASVHAVASPASVSTTGFQAVLGGRPFVPRASTGCDLNALCNIVGKDGVFSIEADPGRFDVSVRPPETTGFSWLVRPNVSVSSEVFDLGQLKMPAPVTYSGTISAPNGAPVARALIRAYVYMDSETYVRGPAGAVSVLQIGETRAGDDASFTLLLPSGLN